MKIVIYHIFNAPWNVLILKTTSNVKYSRNKWNTIILFFLLCDKMSAKLKWPRNKTRNYNHILIIKIEKKLLCVFIGIDMCYRRVHLERNFQQVILFQQWVCQTLESILILARLQFPVTHSNKGTRCSF